MKKYLLMAASLALLMSPPLFAEQTNKANPKQDVRICKTHCDIMKLENDIDAYKKQAASENKMATKEALKKKIQDYQRMLDELNKKLESE